MSVLKGGEDPHSRRRLMRALIALQVAFCFLVLFVAGLFAATFDKLSHRPIGFSPERLLLLETVTERAEPPVFWDQVAQHLRGVPGVEMVALAGRALLGGNSWNGFISVNAAPPGPVLAYFLSVSPGWMQAMKIRVIEGVDFRPNDTSPGTAIVNETFARQFFRGERPLGKVFAKGQARYQIVGVVRDAPYRGIREGILPVAFVPFHSVDAAGAMLPVRTGTFVIRTLSDNPLALASTLRREVPNARPEFRVSNIQTQAELVRSQTIRERLLAMLALFFATVALLLAGVGLYGVLDYSVTQRRREIGIRMAIGARAGDIARRVTGEVLVMVVVGGLAGAALGLVSVRYLESLLFELKGTDLAMLLLPAVAVLAAAGLAAMPAVIRAVRIDPVTIMRSE